MFRLLDRNRQIPHGLKFVLPEAKWESPPWASFETIVDAALQVGRANPYIAKKSNWPTSRKGWADMIDTYNAALCKAHGWDNFIVDDGTGQFPKPQSPHSLSQFAGEAVAGAKVLAEMFGPQGPIKDQALADHRAEVCVTCPKHDTGDWTRFFTVPAQKLIMKLLGAVKDLNLTTHFDASLKVCTACHCPMKGKVWARTEHILKHMPAEDKAALDVNCWITNPEQSNASLPLKSPSSSPKT